MGFVASFLLIYQPQLRSTSLSTTSVGRIFKTPSALDLQQTGSYKYMTYDQLSENARRNGYQVKYTSRGFEIDGQGTLLLGGSIHYPRSTPEMWDDLLLKARHDGLNHIEICKSFTILFRL
jgi:hypothetical protein